MHQIPRIGGLDLVGERWHRSSIQTGHEDPIQILVGLPALEPRSSGEVVGPDRDVFAVGQRRGRRPVPETRRSMALPAFHLLEQLPAMKNAFRGCRSLRWNRY